MLTVLVRGAGDVGSAVAHRLFSSGYAVVMHDGPQPTTTRRKMAFADAIFDGRAVLEGVTAVRLDALGDLIGVAATREAIPVTVADIGLLLEILRPDILVDARMQKRARPEAAARPGTPDHRPGTQLRGRGDDRSGGGDRLGG